MRVQNVHEREYLMDLDSVGALIDSLASSSNHLWPAENWPPMRFDKRLNVGARGGHGPIRYFVEQYMPSRRVVFRFLAPRGFDGTHGFEVEVRHGRSVLRHLLRMRISGLALLSWPMVFRPLHNALVEDSLDKATASIGDALSKPVRWSAYVRVLRVLFKVARTLIHGQNIPHNDGDSVR